MSLKLASIRRCFIFRIYYINKSVIVYLYAYGIVNAVAQTIFLRQHQWSTLNCDMIFCGWMLAVKGRYHTVCAPNHLIHKDLTAVRNGVNCTSTHIETNFDGVALFPFAINANVTLCCVDNISVYVCYRVFAPLGVS